MYENYETNGELTLASMTKYNRLKKSLSNYHQGTFRSSDRGIQRHTNDHGVTIPRKLF